ncbi:hypothetical protein AGDE_14051 [Angomonas deanei]|uniref:Uncharacterized protein n=1 Tax=Angomonas deanei TaxID=59799 RepID=A0A7G2CT07_9TRYP|nr:hypothetical protein AGDE_14051 [Angomonas deanei]CAD2222928.1 hypothetical protein, conserved [Angomonas deanei]|eukprot:EPY21517.1 hypothetical protein AGDE_14051 [Angomonas deanei]
MISEEEFMRIIRHNVKQLHTLSSGASCYLPSCCQAEAQSHDYHTSLTTSGTTELHVSSEEHPSARYTNQVYHHNLLVEEEHEKAQTSETVLSRPIHLSLTGGSVSCARLQQRIKKECPVAYLHYVEQSPHYNGRWHLYVQEKVGLCCGHYSSEKHHLVTPAHITSSELRCFIPTERKNQPNNEKAHLDRHVFLTDFFLGCLLEKYTQEETLWEEVCRVVEEHIREELKQYFTLMQQASPTTTPMNSHGSYILHVYRSLLLYGDNPHHSSTINLPKLANHIVDLLVYKHPIVAHLSRGALRSTIIRLAQRDRALSCVYSRHHRVVG